MTTHKIDSVTRRCIYCNLAMRQLFNEPQKCARRMQPVDEPHYGEPILTHLVKYIAKDRRL